MGVNARFHLWSGRKTLVYSELTVTKKQILAITTVMTVVEFVAVTGYIFANEHDLVFSLILGAPAAILMFVISGVLLTIVYYRR